MCCQCETETVEEQLAWLHLKLPDTGKTNSSNQSSNFLAASTCLCKSSRVWTKHAVRDAGITKSLVPQGLGGTVIFEDIDGVSMIRWDDFRITMHPEQDFDMHIQRIGWCASMGQYMMENQSRLND